MPKETCFQSVMPKNNRKALLANHGGKVEGYEGTEGKQAVEDDDGNESESEMKAIQKKFDEQGEIDDEKAELLPEFSEEDEDESSDDEYLKSGKKESEHDSDESMSLSGEEHTDNEFAEGQEALLLLAGMYTVHHLEKISTGRDTGAEGISLKSPKTVDKEGGGSSSTGDYLRKRTRDKDMVNAYEEGGCSSIKNDSAFKKTRDTDDKSSEQVTSGEGGSSSIKDPYVEEKTFHFKSVVQGSTMSDVKKERTDINASAANRGFLRDIDVKSSPKFPSGEGGSSFKKEVYVEERRFHYQSRAQGSTILYVKKEPQESSGAKCSFSRDISSHSMALLVSVKKESQSNSAEKSKSIDLKPVTQASQRIHSDMQKRLLKSRDIQSSLAKQPGSIKTEPQPSSAADANQQVIVVSDSVIVLSDSE